MKTKNITLYKALSTFLNISHTENDSNKKLQILTSYTFWHATTFCMMTRCNVGVMVDTGKVKQSRPCALIKHHATKAYWGSGGITPSILDLDTR